MKRNFLLILVMALCFSAQAIAADAVAPETTETAPAPVEAVAAPAVTETEAAPVAVTTEAPEAQEAINQDNLEFVSGEVSAIDEAAKTVTVKLYGESEDDASDKVLTVKLDEATDITDGEKDRDIKSLAAGTEVDVEYDPASNKATYVFVY